MSNCANCGNELRTCGKCGFSKVYEEDMMHLTNAVATLKQEKDQLKAQKAALVECVKHYADRRNHPPFWSYDDGELARECLAQIGGVR